MLLSRLEGAFHGIRTTAMAFDTGEAALLGPAAITIHDDGDVPGNSRSMLGFRIHRKRDTKPPAAGMQVDWALLAPKFRSPRLKSRCFGYSRHHRSLAVPLFYVNLQDMRYVTTAFVFFWVSLSCVFADTAAASKSTAGLKPFIEWLLEDGERLEDVPFAEVVEAVSGRVVLPVEASVEPDGEMLAAIHDAVAAMLLALASPEHPVHEAKRINETSRYVEKYLLEHLNRVAFLECRIPVNASGDVQRSGYPDLRVEHLDSGRVFYLDPKVYKRSSEASSFRSFYFEPKRETNKILDDASHLILGISHAGKADGLWQFEGWKLVDLVDFRVRLKAEFQASNRDLYREEAVKLSGP